MMVWGGLRGGISIALALSLPPSEYRDLIVAMTYGVVIFSIVVQGLTIENVADQMSREASPSEAARLKLRLVTARCPCPRPHPCLHLRTRCLE